MSQCKHLELAQHHGQTKQLAYIWYEEIVTVTCVCVMKKVKMCSFTHCQFAGRAFIDKPRCFEVLPVVGL